MVVFSHGYSDIRTGCTALNSDLASHGCVMACVEHRDRSAGITVRKIPKPGAPGEYDDEWITTVYDEDETTGPESRREQVRSHSACLLDGYNNCKPSKILVFHFVDSAESW